MISLLHLLSEEQLGYYRIITDISNERNETLAMRIVKHDGDHVINSWDWFSRILQLPRKEVWVVSLSEKSKRLGGGGMAQSGKRLVCKPKGLG